MKYISNSACETEAIAAEFAKKLKIGEDFCSVCGYYNDTEEEGILDDDDDSKGFNDDEWTRKNIRKNLKNHIDSIDGIVFWVME